MPDFFINRPIFAWVVALLISLVGLLALPMLPVAQYPDIAPPVITIRTTYPGASAQVTEEAVTAVIEKEINGAPGLLYMSATSDSNGMVEIAVTFQQGTDPDIAAVEVQNRLKIVESRLPESVRREGVFVEKSSNNIQAVISLSSDGALDGTELGELASARLIPELKRVKGVGRVELFGAEMSMRIWPDPEKLEALRLTPTDIVSAVASQSERIIIGDIGGAAVSKNAPINASVVASEELHTPEDFEAIALRTLPDGSSVKLGDVARVELGANNYSFFSRCNGLAATGMAIKMAPGSNAVETMGLLRDKMDELSKDFPPGVSYQIPYETTHFVEISIQKVVSTLLEAIGLVFLVMFLFLQNFRATLIPTLVVPVALLGTFAVMWISGFSVNMLTMFGMVLSIGILVDDAIVVVENVERIMQEEGLDARQATIKAMKQIGGAIVGITAVLVSVFIPMAFFSGAVGNIYRQFSVTLIVSISFSAFLALSLTPALCAAMLKPSFRGASGQEGLLRLVQQDDQPLHGTLWKNRLRHHQAARPFPLRVRPRHCRGRLPVPHAAFLLPSGRGPGELHGACLPAARHPSGRNERPPARRGRLSDEERTGEARLFRGRFQLLRQRDEHGHALRRPEGLERAHGPGPGRR